MLFTIDHAHNVSYSTYISTVPQTIRPGDVAEITIASTKTDAWTSDADVTLYDSMNKSISNIKANGIQGELFTSFYLLLIILTFILQHTSTGQV